MGCCGSSYANVDELYGSPARDQAISAELLEAKQLQDRMLKVLLLGIRHSGKSTLLKQLIQLHGNSYNEKDCIYFRSYIYDVLITQSRLLLGNLKHFHPSIYGKLISDNNLSASINYLMAFQPDNDGMLLSNTAQEESYTEIHHNSPKKFNEISQHISNIFKTSNEHWKTIFSLLVANRFNHFMNYPTGPVLLDVCAYFFDNLKRIGSTTYVPNAEDILRAPSPAKSNPEGEEPETVRGTPQGGASPGKIVGMSRKKQYVTQIDLEVKKVHYAIIDLNGRQSTARSFKAKINPLFDSVAVVLFVASLSSFDQWISWYDDDQSVARRLTVSTIGGLVGGTATPPKSPSVDSAHEFDEKSDVDGEWDELKVDSKGKLNNKYTENKKNMLHETIDFFRDVYNSHWFVDVPIVLFLNKKEEFDAKLTAGGKTLSEYCFEEFDENTKSEEDKCSASLDYIRKQFMSVNRLGDDGKKIYCHVLVSLEAGSVKKAWQDTVTTIVAKDLKLM